MKRIHTLQNLILIAVADGKITREEIDTVNGYAVQMGISQEEVNALIKKIDVLDFIIPETPEERRDELYKLTQIALVDNELASEEYSELLFFAESCGLNESQLKEYIDAAFERRDLQEEAVIKDNLFQYDLVLEVVRKSKKSDPEIAHLLSECTKTRNLDLKFSEDADINLAFYRFMWFMYCRYVKLNSGGIVMLAMQLDLAKSGNYSLDDIIYDFKLTEEGYHDGLHILLDQTKLEVIKTDLKNTFPFNK
jgi:hypothetical protein